MYACVRRTLHASCIIQAVCLPVLADALDGSWYVCVRGLYDTVEAGFTGRHTGRPLVRHFEGGLNGLLVRQCAARTARSLYDADGSGVQTLDLCQVTGKLYTYSCQLSALLLDTDESNDAPLRHHGVGGDSAFASSETTEQWYGREAFQWCIWDNLQATWPGTTACLRLPVKLDTCLRDGLSWNHWLLDRKISA